MKRDETGSNSSIALGGAELDRTVGRRGEKRSGRIKVVSWCLYPFDSLTRFVSSRVDSLGIPLLLYRWEKMKGTVFEQAGTVWSANLQTRREWESEGATSFYRLDDPGP